MGGLGGFAPQPAANPVIGKKQLYDKEPAGSLLRRPLFCHGFHGVFQLNIDGFFVKGLIWSSISLLKFSNYRKFDSRNQPN